MTLDLAEVAGAIGAAAPGTRLFGRNGIDARVNRYCIDSRTATRGDLFFALRGPHHDGHDYVAQVIEKAGAAAAVVERGRLASGDPRLIETGDTLEALQRLATWARGRITGDVVGITGSAGKTTTKDVIAKLLGATGLEVSKTAGNYNNHVGVPLSVLHVSETARFAVLELGMNHAGEIRALAQIARPRVAVVTNVGSAHIEAFDSIDGIALAKRELVESLPADGVAVLNADDPRVAAFARVHPGRTVTFGLGEDANVRAVAVSYAEDGVRFRVGDVEFRSPLAGRIGVLNILAGIAVAGLFGIAPAELREAVAALEPGAMRGRRMVRNGITIWNDCYNANPDAVRGMLDVLRDASATRRIAVLGEMLELGRWAEALHRDVGAYAVGCGVSVLVGIRGAARYLVEAAVQSGLANDAAYFFEDPAEAGEFLRTLARAGDAILFKGSRGTRVEIALERFLR